VTNPPVPPGFSYRKIKRTEGQGAPYWDGIRVALLDFVSPPENLTQALERLCAKQTFCPSDLPVKKSGKPNGVAQ
jgi:hypothetical protein